MVPPRIEGYAINEDEYDKRLVNSMYLRKKEADRNSYNWDSLIEYFERLYKRVGFFGPETNFELGMQILASRRRVERRYLSRSLLSALETPHQSGQRLMRGHLTDKNETCIVFSVIHKYSTWNFQEYKDIQLTLMRLYAIQISLQWANLKTVIVLGFESISSRQFGNVFMLVGSAPEARVDTGYDDLIDKLRIFKNVETGIHTEKEYPE